VLSVVARSTNVAAALKISTSTLGRAAPDSSRTTPAMRPPGSSTKFAVVLAPTATVTGVALAVEQLAVTQGTSLYSSST
jgi:hypothetical protein